MSKKLASPNQQAMRAAPLLAVVAALLVAAPAAADTASVDTVTDAGNGQITVTYTVTSDSGDPGQPLEPGGPVFGRNYAWYAYLAEDHASRACSPAWANYLRHVETLHEDPGTVTRTVTFTPFFPRQIKLCVYLNNPAGERAMVERIVDIPAGYGRQRSSGYNCEHFSRSSAQDYYWLYPGDPSDLDADNDGAACEENTGAQPGPQIPAEPTPALAVDTCNDGIDSDGDGKVDLGDLENGNIAGIPSRSCDQTHSSCQDFIDNDRDGKTDWQDADVSGNGILAATRCDQTKPVARRPPTPKPVFRPVRLLCNKFVGRRGRNVAYRTTSPRRCAVWRADWAHYQALTFVKAHWSAWGSSTARARVTLTGNSGYRAPGRIKAYRLHSDCTGRYRVYTRVRLASGGDVKRTVVFKPDTCAG
jgi:hypothetical protein